MKQETKMKAEFKPVFNANRVNLHEVLPLDTPYAVSICPSQMCNIGCKYCVHSLGKNGLEQKGFSYKHIDWNIFLKVVEQLKEFPRKIKSISMCGQGEPLANPRFPEMVKIVKEAEVAEDISFITNAILLNPKKGKEIIDAGLDRIFISLQGLTAQKYEEVCGAKINFEKYVENLREFYEYSRGKCQVNIKIADIALEEGEKEKFFEMFGNICDTIHIETIKPLYADVDYTNILGENKSNMTTSRFGRPHVKQSACYLSFYMLTIDPDGGIRPCGAPFDPCYRELGNVQTTTLLKAWNSRAYHQFCINMLEGKRFENPVCKDCDYPNDVPYEGDEIDPYVDLLLPKYKELIK